MIALINYVAWILEKICYHMWYPLLGCDLNCTNDYDIVVAPDLDKTKSNGERTTSQVFHTLCLFYIQRSLSHSSFSQIQYISGLIWFNKHYFIVTWRSSIPDNHSVYSVVSIPWKSLSTFLDINRLDFEWSFAYL